MILLEATEWMNNSKENTLLHINTIEWARLNLKPSYADDWHEQNHHKENNNYNQDSKYYCSVATEYCRAN